MKRAVFIPDPQSSLFGIIQGVRLLIQNNIACIMVNDGQVVYTMSSPLEEVDPTLENLMRPHRWSTGSRTCDGCGCDYDWAIGECLGPLPKDDVRRRPRPPG